MTQNHQNRAILVKNLQNYPKMTPFSNTPKNGLKTVFKKNRHSENRFFGVFLGCPFTATFLTRNLDPQKVPKRGLQRDLTIFPLPGPLKNAIFDILGTIYSPGEYREIFTPFFRDPIF
jgi:hypothetical protein